MGPKRTDGRRDDDDDSARLARTAHTTTDTHRERTQRTRTHARTHADTRARFERASHTFDIAFADATPRHGARMSDDAASSLDGVRTMSITDMAEPNAVRVARVMARCVRAHSVAGNVVQRMGATKRRLNEHFFGILSRRTRDSRLTM